MLTFLENRIPPPIVGLATAVLMWQLAGHIPALTGISALQWLLVAVLAGCGLTLDLLALIDFFKRKTTFNPLAPERASTLVTGGMYRFSRNPMYLGMLLNLLAWGCFLGHWAALLPPWLFVLFISHFQILPEERALQQLFGTDFTNYRRIVRRWL